MTPGRILRFTFPALLLTTPGCIARTALDVATLPVKAGAKAVDVATTSEEEADRARGQKMRHRCKRDDCAE